MMWLIALIFTGLVATFLRIQGYSWRLVAIVVGAYLLVIWAISSFGY